MLGRIFPAYTWLRAYRRSDLVARAGWHERYGKRIDYLSLEHALRDIGLM